jgi:hypothetical protein
MKEGGDFSILIFDVSFTLRSWFSKAVSGNFQESPFSPVLIVLSSLRETNLDQSLLGRSNSYNLSFIFYLNHVETQF